MLSTETRAGHYRLLARLFTDQTSPADLEAYRAHILALPGTPGFICQPFLETLDRWMGRGDADRELRVEYARLFLLPGGVKPFESVYRGEQPLLMREPWVRVKHFYLSCGLRAERGDGAHPEDHVSVELSFMAHLAAQETCQELEARFFDEHLRPWVPAFLSDVQNNKDACFFKEAAAYGLSFLETEKQLFDQLYRC